MGKLWCLDSTGNKGLHLRYSKKSEEKKTKKMVGPLDIILKRVGLEVMKLPNYSKVSVLFCTRAFGAFGPPAFDKL